MAIYMKLGSIPGSVTTQGYEQWIGLESFDWGFAASGTFTQSGAEVTVREATVQMRVEKASPLLVNAGLSRTVLRPSVKIAFTTTAQGGVGPYLTYELSDCIISHYAIKAGAEGHPVETLSLNFTKVTETFNPKDASLTGSPTSVTYDVKAAQTS